MSFKGIGKVGVDKVSQFNISEINTEAKAAIF
jgi:hypothetical protein